MRTNDYDDFDEVNVKLRKKPPKVKKFKMNDDREKSKSKFKNKNRRVNREEY